MAEPIAHHLNSIVHDDDVRGPLRLYVFDANGRHSGGKWFENKPRYPDEMITTARAKQHAAMVLVAEKEIRITNASDYLVFHAIDGKVIHPADGWEGFWKRVQEAK